MTFKSPKKPQQPPLNNNEQVIKQQQEPQIEKKLPKRSIAKSVNKSVSLNDNKVFLEFEIEKKLIEDLKGNLFVSIFKNI